MSYLPSSTMGVINNVDGVLLRSPTRKMLQTDRGRTLLQTRHLLCAFYFYDRQISDLLWLYATQQSLHFTDMPTYRYTCRYCNAINVSGSGLSAI